MVAAYKLINGPWSTAPVSEQGDEGAGAVSPCLLMRTSTLSCQTTNEEEARNLDFYVNPLVFKC